MVRKSDKSVIVSGKGPIMSVALGLCFSVAIAFNALSRQDARHPAPFEGFWMLESQSGPAKTQLLKPRQTMRSPRAAAPSKLILDVQSELTKMGYYDGTVDGLIGPQTRAAITRYQREHELTSSGQATTGLLDHIKFNRRIRDAVKQAPVSQSSDAQARIQLVQTGLAELGYAPGPIDGVMGGQTVNAIRSFERDRRLQVTGKVTDGLITELQKTTGLSSLAALDKNG